MQYYFMDEKMNAKYIPNDWGMIILNLRWCL